MEFKVNILGSIWKIKFIQREEDPMFDKKTCDGYCDHSIKTIALMEDPGDSEIADYETYLRQNIRHELIHAFMHESGLGCNWEHPNRWGQDETTVDWFAVQIPKINRAYEDIISLREGLNHD